MKSLLITILMITTIILVASCISTKTKESPQKVIKPVTYQKCTKPRPQVCTREYKPVCATIDADIRCIKSPCPSTKKRTYATACTACADPKVYGYVVGLCGK